MGMLMAGMAVRMHMSDIFMPVHVVMDKVMGFQEGEIFQDLFRCPIPDFPFIFPHHYYPIRYLRHNVYILSSCDNRAALLAEFEYCVYEMP